MKKAMMMGVVLAGVLGAFSVSAADESFLYWMVDTDATTDFTYNKVQVRAFTGEDVDSGSALTLYYGNAIEAGTYVSAEDVAEGLPFYAALATSYGGAYSYVIELFNDSVKVGQSDPLAYTTAAAQEYIVQMTSAGTLPAMATWSPSSYTAVPEPSSAMLVILGCAALALRRGKTKTRG